MKTSTTTSRLLLTALATSALVACGGGGGGGSSASTAVPLSGSISQGAPIAGATITLTDAKGTVLDGGTSASDGSYTIPDISSLTAPIIVSAKAVVGGTPVTYRSLLAQKGAQNTANVTPITDAVLVQSTGKSAAVIEGSASTELPSLDLTKLTTTTNKFVTSISNVLDQISAGTSTTFNPFTTAFVADGESAADKVNDLVKVTTTITPTGVQTDITDKSNSVGTVTISDSTTATALPMLPANLLAINPKYLASLIDKSNYLFSNASILDSSEFENGISADFLEDGQDKAGFINMLRTQYRTALLGAKFSNPKLVSCDVNNVCHVQMTMKNTNLDTVLEGYYKYDPSSKIFQGYGNHRAYKAEFESSLTKSIDNSGNETLYSQIQFYILDRQNLNKYKSATATLQSGSSAPDATYNFILKPTACPPANDNIYDGMPLDDGTNSCATWKQFTPGNESLLKDINAKIKQGNYTVKIQAWTTDNRNGTPDVAIIPVTDPILTTDMIGPSGYPNVKIEQGSSGSLPYLSIDNADDFIVSGTVCITSGAYCDKSNPQGHTTQSQPGDIKLPSKYPALAADGWQAGEKAKGYFIHVRDKAGRDMMISKYNY